MPVFLVLGFISEAIGGEEPATATPKPETALHELELVLIRALSNRPTADDSVSQRAEIGAALKTAQTSFAALKTAREARNDAQAVVLNAALDSDIAGTEVPDFKSLESVMDLIRRASLLQPCESEFFGEALAAILDAVPALYTGESRAAIERWRSEWVDWDEGRIASGIYFQEAGQIFNRQVLPLLGWQQVQRQALADAINTLEEKYSAAAACLRTPKNLAVVYSAHSDQLERVGRSLRQGDFAERIRYRAQSCSVLADGIVKVAASSPSAQGQVWLVKAKQSLFERADGLIRQDLLPNRKFEEIRSLSVQLLSRPEALRDDRRARLFAYAAQCDSLLGKNEEAKEFFDKANYLVPGILTQKDLRNLKAVSQR